MGAEDHFRQGEEFFVTPEFRRRPGVIAQTYGNAALIAWLFDDEAGAQQRIDHALAVAHAKDNPYDLAYAECMTAIHLALLNKFEAAARLARSSIVLSDKHTFPQFAAISRVALGVRKQGWGSLPKARRSCGKGWRAWPAPQCVSQLPGT